MAPLVVPEGLFRPGRVGVLVTTFPDPPENGLVALLVSVPCQGPRDFCGALGEALRPRQAPGAEVGGEASLPLLWPECEPGV